MARIFVQRRGNTEKSIYALVAIVRLWASEAGADSFATISNRGRVVKCESDALENTEKLGDTSYMLYHICLGQLGNPALRQGPILEPVELSRFMAKREQTRYLHELIEISINAAEKELMEKKSKKNQNRGMGP